MKRRSFVKMLSVTPLAAFVPPTRTTPPALPFTLDDGKGPAHECVDRPELPCPACTKWTGDPLAIKKTFPR
jgi:hypothetical protein